MLDEERHFREVSLPKKKLVMPDLRVNGNEEFKRVSMRVREWMHERMGIFIKVTEHFIKDFLRVWIRFQVALITSRGIVSNDRERADETSRKNCTEQKIDFDNVRTTFATRAVLIYSWKNLINF